MLELFKNKALKNPLWLSVSEAAKIGGIKDKTVRRALKAESGLKFKIINNRYQIELASLVIYLHRSTKLKNKFFEHGLGQYWPKENDHKK